MSKLFNFNKSIIFENNNFRNLWFARTISYFGDSLYNIALMWLVYEKTGSAFHVGLILVAKFLPQLLFSMIFGVWIDKWNRKWLMQISDFIQAFTTGVFAVLLFVDVFELQYIYFITIILSLCNNLFGISNTSILPELVKKDLLITANSLLSTSQQVARLVGSTVGGILIAYTGEATVIAINAITFFVSLAFIQFIRYEYTPNQQEGVKHSLINDIVEGFTWLKKERALVTLILIGMLSNVALGPTNVLPPMLIKEDFNGTAAALGVFDSFIGIGLLAGAVLVGIVSPKKIGMWFSFGLGMQSIGMLVISFSPNLIFANLGNLILGIAIIITNIPMSTFFQVMVPTNMRGRINSISSVSFNFSIPITYGVVGILADKIGAQEVYAIGTAMLFICVVLAFTNKELVKSYIGADEGKKQEQVERNL